MRRQQTKKQATRKVRGCHRKKFRFYVCRSKHSKYYVDQIIKIGGKNVISKVTKSYVIYIEKTISKWDQM